MATERQVSKALIETVQENKHIDKVHFDAQGRHWLNVFEGKGLHKGVLFGHIARKNVVNKEGTINTIETPTEATRIVETIERETLLKLEPVSDLMVNMNTLSPEELKFIEKLRAKKG